MKKRLITAAVAATIATPMAASADVTVYGQLHYSIDSIDLNENTGGVGPGMRRFPTGPLGHGATYLQGTGIDSLAQGYDGSGVNSHNSRFGIKGSEDLGNGLSAVFQMEFSISGDDLGGVNNNRNTYVALAGSWGVAGIGQVDTPYKSSTGSLELFSEQVGDNNALFFDDIRAQDAVFYMSPNWNGFSFVAAVVMPSLDNDADGIEATSIAATYSNGPWFASLAYEELSGEMVDVLYSSTNTTDPNLTTMNDGINDANDFSKWRLGLGYTANGFHVGFVYEDREVNDLAFVPVAFEEDGESWQLSASYTVGNNTFKIAYGEADGLVRDSSHNFNVSDAEMWSIGVDHKLSNRTKIYAAYTDFESDDNEPLVFLGFSDVDTEYDAFSVGIIHKF